jgi:hypothetical protein
MSFDMGPYRFDLTPFVGLLNAEATADISLSVLGNNGQSGGLWYMNGVLLAYPDEAFAGQVLGGALMEAQDGGAHSKLTRKTEGDMYTFVTSGSHHFNVTGRLDFPNGTSVQTSVATALSASNVNTLGPTTQVSHGVLRSETTVTMGLATMHSVEQWPYNISSSYAEDATTMDLGAEVRVTYERTLEMSVPKVVDEGGRVTPVGGSSFHAHWSNDHSAAAAYNRSLDRHHTYVQEGSATEVFGITTSKQGACYRRELHADGGEIELDEGKYDCELPAGMSFCNYHICPSADLRPSKVTLRPKQGGVAGSNESRFFSGGQHASAQHGMGLQRLPGRSPLQQAAKRREEGR